MSSLCCENAVNSSLRTDLKNIGLATRRLANFTGHSHLLKKSSVVGVA